jgi:hypothetical protein
MAFVIKDTEIDGPDGLALSGTSTRELAQELIDVLPAGTIKDRLVVVEVEGHPVDDEDARGAIDDVKALYQMADVMGGEIVLESELDVADEDFNKLERLANGEEDNE